MATPEPSNADKLRALAGKSGDVGTLASVLLDELFADKAADPFSDAVPLADVMPVTDTPLRFPHLPADHPANTGGVR